MPELSKRVILKGLRAAQKEFTKVVQLRLLGETQAAKTARELEKDLRALQRRLARRRNVQ